MREALIVLTGVSLATSALLLVDSSPASAANTVTVFYDLDNDGVRDPGEPGVPGVMMNSGGAAKAQTDASGRATLSALNGSGKIVLSTGWYRSDCASLNCPPAKDNDFGAYNQMIRLLNGTAGTSYTVGLVPDWPGGYGAMPSRFNWNDANGNGRLDLGEATGSGSNAIDISTRNSWIENSNRCNGAGSYGRLCDPGERVVTQFQVFNEGTERLTGITGTIEVPFDGLIQVTSSRSPANVPGVSIDVGSYDETAGAYPFTLSGALLPAQAAQFVVTYTIPSDADPSPKPYDGDHTITVVIGSVDQWSAGNDPDSAKCQDNRWHASCEQSVGFHDKQSSPSDNSDDLDWNVSGSATTEEWDVALTGSVPAGPHGPGAVVPVTLTVRNQGTEILRSPTIVAHIPAGLVFRTADNPTWSDDATSVLGGQIRPGHSASTEINLRVAGDATTADSGTLQMRASFEISKFWEQLGRTHPADKDSTPDNDRAGEDDQSTIDVAVDSDGDPPPTSTTPATTTTLAPSPTTTTTVPAGSTACAVTRSGSTATITWVDIGGTDVLRRDGKWLATPTGDTYVDDNSPDGASYIVRTRIDGAVIDRSCTLTGDGPSPTITTTTTTTPTATTTTPPLSGCVVGRDGTTATITWSSLGGTDIVRRNGAWLATPAGDTYVDDNSPAGATYIVRTWTNGAATDRTCVDTVTG